MDSTRSLLILGASARAAAASALRGDFAPIAVDLFGDADLLRLAPTHVVQHYPDELFAVARSLPPAPWLYTGGLENVPTLVDELAQQRPLYGNPGHVLRRVRDPIAVAAAAHDAGIAWPACRALPVDVPCGGSWLVKRRHASGGRHVVPWIGQTIADVAEWYWQRRVSGLPCAAVYAADGGRAQLLGVSEQLISVDWLGGRDFWYCGSLGPMLEDDVDPARRFSSAEFQRLGAFLADAFDLRGLFGVDGILSDGRFWPVEINPRFPASVEVLEQALGFSAVQLHVAACTANSVAPSTHASHTEELPRAGRVVGKAVVYARDAAHVDHATAEAFLRRAAPVVRYDMQPDAPRGANSLPATWLADIPLPDTHIASGRPILTVLAAGARRDEVLERLRSTATEVLAALDPRRPANF